MNTKLTLPPIFTINTTADTVYNNLDGSEPDSFLQVKGTLIPNGTLYIIICLSSIQRVNYNLLLAPSFLLDLPIVLCLKSINAMANRFYIQDFITLIRVGSRS